LDVAHFQQINWAVGFGPTKYADYKLGESTLPIEVLTDADLKWLVTAEYGGTGGLEVQQGMVVEEPDIEIGAGPSSKGLLSFFPRSTPILTVQQLSVDVEAVATATVVISSLVAIVEVANTNPTLPGSVDLTFTVKDRRLTLTCLSQ
jgi:hypothetical protein